MTWELNVHADCARCCGPHTAPPAAAGYVQVALALVPVVHTEAEVELALSAALRDGRLAAALQAVGVRLAPSGGAQLASAAPGDSKATVGAAVGGAVGGAAAVFLAAAVYLLARRSRRLKAVGGHKDDGLPVSGFLPPDEAVAAATMGGGGGKLKVRGARGEGQGDYEGGNGRQGTQLQGAYLGKQVPPLLCCRLPPKACH